MGGACEEAWRPVRGLERQPRHRDRQHVQSSPARQSAMCAARRHRPAAVPPISAPGPTTPSYPPDGALPGSEPCTHACSTCCQRGHTLPTHNPASLTPSKPPLQPQLSSLQVFDFELWKKHRSSSRYLRHILGLYNSRIVSLPACLSSSSAGWPGVSLACVCTELRGVRASVGCAVPLPAALPASWLPSVPKQTLPPHLPACHATHPLQVSGLMSPLLYVMSLSLGVACYNAAADVSPLASPGCCHPCQPRCRGCHLLRPLGHPASPAPLLQPLALHPYPPPCRPACCPCSRS